MTLLPAATLAVILDARDIVEPGAGEMIARVAGATGVLGEDVLVGDTPWPLAQAAIG